MRSGRSQASQGPQEGKYPVPGSRQADWKLGKQSGWWQRQAGKQESKQVGRQAVSKRFDGARSMPCIACGAHEHLLLHQDSGSSVGNPARGTSTAIVTERTTQLGQGCFLSHRFNRLKRRRVPHRHTRRKTRRQHRSGHFVNARRLRHLRAVRCARRRAARDRQRAHRHAERRNTRITKSLPRCATLLLAHSSLHCGGGVQCRFNTGACNTTASTLKAKADTHAHNTVRDQLRLRHRHL